MAATTLLTTDIVPARERTRYWCDMIWHAFGGLRSDTYGDPCFTGRIHQADFGAVRVCRLEASRHRVVRTAGVRSSSDPGYLKLVVQHRGSSVFEQDGRVAKVAPGEWSLYDTTDSYAVSNPEPVEQHVLLLPRDALLRGQRTIQSLLVRPLRASAGLGRIACEAVRTAVEEAERTPSALRPELGDTLTHLIRLALLEQLADVTPQTGRQIMRLRVHAHIERRLDDPDLSLDSIARELNCSKRLLHRAFHDDGCTPLEYIRLRRLERIRDDLENPALASRSITEIAFRWGFSSAAHFSRSFRSRFGASPRDWREGARQAQPRPFFRLPLETIGRD